MRWLPYVQSERKKSSAEQRLKRSEKRRVSEKGCVPASEFVTLSGATKKGRQNVPCLHSGQFVGKAFSLGGVMKRAA